MYDLPKSEISCNVEKNSWERQNEESPIPKNSVSFLTLGCRLNQSETDILTRIFKLKGYKVVHSSEPTDICIINTCTVTNQGDSKNRQAIRSMNRLNPKAVIVVIGCYAQLAYEEISKLKGVRLIIGNERKMEVFDYLEMLDTKKQPIIVNDKIGKNSFSTPIVPKNLIKEVINKKSLKQNNSKKYIPILTKSSRTRALLKIQDGCNFMCSFCVIPFARGRSRYREYSNLLKEAHFLVKEGAREIVITGVNIGTYKNDNFNFVNVVDSLNSIKGLDRIRISSIEPTTVPKILFEYMRDSQHKLVPYFHLPLQSGSDNILKKMNRRYSSSEFSEEIWRACEAVPDICLGTDVMVGFPEEDEAEFGKTLNLLKILPLTYFHVFPFSNRKKTAAYKIKDKIKSDIKKKRSKILHDLSTKKRKDFYKRFLGKTKDVLFESCGEDLINKGYTDNFIKVLLEEEKNSNFRNKILPVKISKIEDNFVLGQTI